jgi:cell division protein FtsW
MARKLKSDAWLFTATMILLAVGIAFVYSASALRAERTFDDPQHFLIRQAMWVALGTALMIGAMRVDYHVYRHPKVLQAMLALSVIGLIAVFFAPAVKGTHRWIGVGGMGVQPSEFAKLVTVLFASAVIGARLEADESPLPAFGKVAAVVGGLLLLIVFEPDGGGAAALAAVAGSIVFVAGLPMRWVVPALLSLPAFVYALVLLEPYRLRRMLVFLNPWEDPQRAGFQVVQSLIAVGTGGLLGRGFMQGVQKLGYLPEAHNDFIFAVIAEEKGLVGATIVLACFAVIIFRGLRVARRAPDAFGSLVAVGITTMIGLQAMINMSVVLSLVPAKGMALPFVSAGGSSMLVSLLAMGILLNISQQASAVE